MTVPRGQRRRELAVLLAAAAVVVGWGIWRVHDQSVYYDEVGSVDTSLKLLNDVFVGDFSKGGNLHLRLVWGLLVVAWPYWAATGQTDIVYSWAGYHTVTSPARMAARADATIMARAVSVVAALVVVYGVYWLVRHHTTHRWGLYGGGLLLLSMGFVTTGKMGTEDMVVTAAMVGTLALATQAVETEDWRWVNLTAVGVGVAVSAKATGGLLFPVLYAAVLLVALRRDGGWQQPVTRFGAYHVVAGYAYFATTPSALRYPITWVNRVLEMTVMTTNGWARYQYLSPAWEVALAHTAVMLGLPLLLLAGVSVLAVHWHRRGSRTLLLPGVLLVVYVLFVTVGSMPQYYRVLPLVPLAALYVALATHDLRHQARPRWRQAGTLAVGCVLVFSAVYAAPAVVDWNTTRIEASEQLDATLDDGATVGTLSQELYWPTYPSDVTVRKYHDETWSNATARGHAVRELRGRCTQYVVLNRFQYHRYFRDPTTHPRVTRVVEWLFSTSEYRRVGHWGPPVALEDDASFKLRQSWQPGHYYANGVGNQPITVLERTRSPADDCEEPTP